MRTDAKDNVKVIIRIRPRIEREYDQNTNHILTEGNSIIVSTRKESKQFTFDYIATEDSSQKDIFNNCAKEICDYVLEGYNGTIFVYGQTGAGKTYTLLGPKYANANYNAPSIRHDLNDSPSILNKAFLSLAQRKEEEGKGILPRVIEYIFSKCAQMEKKNKSQITISCSFLEIYKEQISDLLDNNSDKTIVIRDLTDNVVIENLEKISVKNSDEALSLIRQGNRYRHIAATNMNKESSRSHAVFSLYIVNKEIDAAGKTHVKKSMFHLIDLAGSERQKSTNCTGERIKEAGNINKSLMQLSHVIKNLSEGSRGKNVHIHYRDSKLTHLLKDSLGGSAKTCIIANISPANGNIKETISTLLFAQSAKLIKNTTIINEEIISTNEAGLQTHNEIMRLKEKYNNLKQENFYLMSLLDEKKISHNVNYRAEYSKTIDYVEEEIENMLNEISTKEKKMVELSKLISELKSKYNTTELELKVKNKIITDKKDLLRAKRRENETLKAKLKEFVMENAYQTKDIFEFDIHGKKITKEKEQVVQNLQNEISLNNAVITTKETIITSTISDIEQYEKDLEKQKIDLNTFKEIQNNLMNSKEAIENEINEEKISISEIEKTKEYYSNELTKLTSEYNLNLNVLQESKEKAKIVINDYNSKIQTMKMKSIEIEEKRNKMKRNYLVNKTEYEKLQNDITTIEEQISIENENKINSLTKEINQLKLKQRQLNESINEAKATNMKLNDEFDILSENKNINSTKISLLTKIKNENIKLKEELNSLKNNFENFYFEGECSKKIDISSKITAKENKQNHYEGIIEKVITKLKKEVNKRENLNESIDNLLQSEQQDEKFNYYFSKVISITSEKQKYLNLLQNENDEKEKQIASLNREMFSKKFKTSQKSGEINRLTLSNFTNIKKKPRNITVMNTVSLPIKFAPKRKYNEYIKMKQEEDKENIYSNGKELFSKNVPCSPKNKKRKDYSFSSTKQFTNDNSSTDFNFLQTINFEN